MQVLKQLNLNKTPQSIPNSSIVCAKNIKLSNDTSYITNEEGLTRLSTIVNGNGGPHKNKAPISRQKDNIVGTLIGTIECPKEVIIFSREVDGMTIVGHVYRLSEYDDGIDFREIQLNWTPRANTIVRGTYNYNANGELIIAIAEYEENPEDDGVPLRVVNIDTADTIENADNTVYNINPSVPICNCKLKYKQLGNPMPQGTYMFYIRYEIEHDEYTKWFPIGVPYQAYNINYVPINTHHWEDENNVDRYNSVYGYINNKKNDCPYNFVLTLSFDDLCGYKTFQLGYILQHEDATVGRIWHKFSLESEQVTITFDASNPTETSVDDLISPVLQLNNVRTLTNFENRIYLGNFKEANANLYTDEIKSCVDDIEVNVHPTLIPSDNNYLDDITSLDHIAITTTSDTYVLISSNQTVTLQGITTPFLPYSWYINTLKDLLADVTVDKDGNTLSDANKFTDLNNVIFTTGTITPDGRRLAINFITHEYLDFSLSDIQIGLQNATLEVIDRSLVPGNPKVLSDIYVYFGSRPPQDLDLWYHIDFSQITGTHSMETDRLDYTNKYTSLIEIPTLDMGEVYSFYVHFIRRDGSYTNGYKLNAETYTPTLWYDKHDSGKLENLYHYIADDFSVLEEQLGTDIPFLSFKNNENTSLYKTYGYTNKGIIKQEVVFSNITIPEGFVGAFFSYEKVEPLVSFTGIVSWIQTAQAGDKTKIHITALDAQLALTNYKGVIIKPAIATGTEHLILDGDAYIGNHDGDGQMPYIELQLNTTDSGGYVVNDIVRVCKYTDNLYTQTTKTLIPFGPILTAASEDTVYSSAKGFVSDFDFYYPSLCLEELSIRYKGVYINDSDNKPYRRVSYMGIGQTPMTESYASSQYYYKISRFNLNAISFKKEPQYIIVVNKDEIDQTLIDIPSSAGYVVKPEDGHDLYELLSMFIPQVLKAYTNYNRYYKDGAFTNMVRRSNIISDESVRTLWRQFDANDYKVIPKDKGVITNIVGVGDTLFVHCEHTLYMAQSQAALTNTASDKYYTQAYNSTKQINISSPDIFDLDLRELFTSNHGFGGLQDSDAWCVNQFGYWFYDNDNKRIYNLDGGKLNDVNGDIVELLQRFDFAKCRFNTDFKRNRLLISFANAIHSNLITLSLYPSILKYISLHDYYFDTRINTKNNCYLCNTHVSNRLYIFDSSAIIGHYDELATDITGMFPVYTATKQIDQNNIICRACYLDIIINEAYEIPKVLDSISYIVSQVQHFNTNDYREAEHQTEYDTLDAESWNHEYPGDKLMIYTDNVNTGILNLYDENSDGEINKFYDAKTNLTAYKFPHYEKGVWNLNYFRNLTNDVWQENFITQQQTKLAMQFGVESYDDCTPKQKAIIDKRVVRFDQLSLIYGKYFVFRFIFNNLEQGRELKFENIAINVKPY